jgi:hypothetical protein
VHGEELLRQQFARVPGLGRSPEEVVERALATVAQQDAILTEEEKKRRRIAVAAMLAFRES